MGISDCRLNGTGTKLSHEDYVLTWRGVDITTRATYGVGIFLTSILTFLHLTFLTAKNVLETEFISERKNPNKRRTGDHSFHPSLRTL